MANLSGLKPMKEATRDEILTAAANGNAAALQFLQVFAKRAHYVDDLTDERGPANPFELAANEEEWLLCLSSNPFFLAHKAQLVPAMVVALNAWVDSNGMLGAPRDVVKGQWHEVVFLVAWLTGGWSRLRGVSAQFRSYDFEEDVAQAAQGKECNGMLR